MLGVDGKDVVRMLTHYLVIDDVEVKDDVFFGCETSLGQNMRAEIDRCPADNGSLHFINRRTNRYGRSQG